MLKHARLLLALVALCSSADAGLISISGGRGVSSGSPPASAYYTGTLRQPTCSDGSIDSAITASSSGDIVRMASACASFTATINIPSTKGILFDGNGSTFNSSSTIDIAPNATISTRVTNFTIACADGSIDVGGSTSSAKWRLDHVTITGSNHRCVTTGTGYGLVDHITAAQLQAADEFFHNEYGGCGSGSSYALCGWNTAADPGSADQIYIEDATFTCPSCGVFAPAWQQSYYGARVVNRFSTLSDVNIDNHGTPGNVGGRWWEIYNVAFVGSSGWDGKPLNLRAGSGVVFNVTRSGSVLQDSFGACEEDSGYPAPYQVGRGQNGALTPAYFFANGTIEQSGGCSDAPGVGGMVQANRDFYDAVGANCTAGGACTTGVGSGTTLPTTCTVGTAFWKTDEGGDWWVGGGDSQDGLLYKCTATNTWTDYFTPYAYPHALQSGLEPDK